MDDFEIVMIVLAALGIFYILYSLWRFFFCSKGACEEYTEYNDTLDNDKINDTIIKEEEK